MPASGPSDSAVSAHLWRRLGELLRYFGVSVIALGVDVMVLWVLARVMHYLLAATAGFVVGAIVSYWLSIRWAFRTRRLARRPRTEFLLFATIGLIGLAINNGAILAGVEWLGWPLLMSKLAAAGITFSSNFVLRKLLLFRLVKT